MKEAKRNLELNKINYYLLCKWFVFGVLLTEIALVMKVIVLHFENIFIQNQKEVWLWVTVAIYALIMGTCLLRKKVWKRAVAVIRSRRFDLLTVFVSGIVSMFFLDGLGIDYFKTLISSLSSLHMVILFSLPVVFFMAIVFRKLQIRFKKNSDTDSSFMSDKEGKSKNDDAFEFSETAKRFAERVYNRGSSESLVFGVDAPWGTGKSTFINICKEHWNENHNDKIIVYTFDPLRFENNDNILEKFIRGLLKTINDYFFAPELESLISKYVKLLSAPKLTFSILGFSFGIPFDKTSIDKIFERLDTVLRGMDKKIVVIVDDLDRLNFSSIKEILFAIKKSFILPNISYVLCYDTENITALEQQKLDTEKIIEFLEKFINIKISLYLDHNLLLNYFTEYKDQSLARNLMSNPELVSKAVDGLKGIFNSKDYYLYIPFIGDARKLKRLINTILLLEVEQLDFSNSDFDKHDLIHLLIIYINYPNIFRKIYNTEAQGKRGFFSLVSKYDEDYPKNIESRGKEYTYENSIRYTEYINNLTDNQKFILNKVFDSAQRLGDSRKVSEEQITSYACFNGSSYSSTGRNLEKYLNLIIKVSRPPHTEQYKFYVNLKNEILKKTNIAEVLSREEFSFATGEENHQQIWTVLINSPHNEYSRDKTNEIIQYALNSLPRYSTLEIDNLSVGLRRHSLIFCIVKLLDKAGWTDEGGNSWNNITENILQIAERIFGENEYSNNGILEYMSKKERGVLGLYDLLIFRLSCCSDRGGDIFNLSRALSNHGGKNNPTSGNVEEIVIGEMREISQYIFKIFKERYIDNNINIFVEVFELSAEAICGDSYEYIRQKISDADLSIKILDLKSGLLAFMIYQLGSAIYGSGIPCGYYDVEGEKDEHGIKDSINEYLFKTCFDSEKNNKGHFYFIYYLFINTKNSFGNSLKRNINIDALIGLLDKNRIKAYWETQREVIRAKGSISEEEEFIVNYGMRYVSHLGDIYKALDELLPQEGGNDSN